MKIVLSSPTGRFVAAGSGLHPARSRVVARLQQGQGGAGSGPKPTPASAEEEEEEDLPDKNAKQREMIKLADKGLTYGAMGTMFLSLFSRANEELGGVAFVLAGKPPPQPSPVAAGKPDLFSANNLLIASVICYLGTLLTAEMDRRLPRE